MYLGLSSFENELSDPNILSLKVREFCDNYFILSNS